MQGHRRRNPPDLRHSALTRDAPGRAVRAPSSICLSEPLRAVAQPYSESGDGAVQAVFYRLNTPRVGVEYGPPMRHRPPRDCHYREHDQRRGDSPDEPSCPTGTFTEQDPAVAAPRALLTTRALLVGDRSDPS